MKSMLWFLAVGGSAAAVHFGVVLLLVSNYQTPALAANVVGFLIAFCVSFLGHHRLTFGDAAASARQSLPRFAAVAVLGFASNEVLYALLLALGVDYRQALLAVLLIVAGMTWLLSRHWAFAAKP